MPHHMQEFRDAIRAVRAVPAVSACAILSLSLGIGATTALFSILNGLLLKPRSCRHPSRDLSPSASQLLPPEGGSYGSQERKPRE